MVTGGYKVERPQHNKLGCLDNYETTGVMWGTSTYGSDLEHHVSYTEVTWGLQGNWAGGGDLEYHFRHNKFPPQLIHIPPRHPEWIPVGEGRGHRYIGGQFVSIDGGNLLHTPFPGVTWSEEGLQLAGHNMAHGSPTGIRPWREFPTDPWEVMEWSGGGPVGWGIIRSTI